MADTIDILETASDMRVPPPIPTPNTKEGLLHTVAMQRGQLNQMARRHQGAFAAARRLVARLTNRVSRLEAKTTWLEAELVEMKVTASQIKAGSTELRAVVNELSERVTQMEVAVAVLERRRPS